MFICVWYLESPAEGVRFLGTVVKVVSELLCVDAGNCAWTLAGASASTNC